MALLITIRVSVHPEAYAPIAARWGDTDGTRVARTRHPVSSNRTLDCYKSPWILNSPKPRRVAFDPWQGIHLFQQPVSPPEALNGTLGASRGS
jgi:hypothetical protein